MKRIMCVIIIVLALGVIGCVAVGVGLPLLMLAHEDEVLRVQLNNPYIDADYYGWKKHNIEGTGGFFLPGEWTISENGELYQFFDENDNVIANGALWDQDKYDYTSFISNLADMEIKELDYERSAHMDGSCFGSMLVNDGTHDQNISFLQLDKYKGDRFVVIFLPENDVVTDELLEAILFSCEMIEY